MSEYDIKLNGVGYMLAKDAQGRLLGGAAREQHVDPFTAQLARDEPYTRAPFRFGDGAGLTEFDGSGRYEWGNGVDARSGRLVLSPEKVGTGQPKYEQIISDTSKIVVQSMDTGGSQHAIGEKHTTPAGYTTIRSLAVLVKRDNTIDYTTYTTLTCRICQDDSGKPGTVFTNGTKNVSVKWEPDPFSPFVDRWRNDAWFWLEITFDLDVVVGASTIYWIVLHNNNSQPLHWAEYQMSTAGIYRSIYNGTSWSAGVGAYPMGIKISYKDGGDQFDSFLRCFQVYRGSDNIERMYCGTNYRILCWASAWGGGHWWESKTVGAPVLQLLEYNDKLFAACGPDTDYWYSDGSSAGSTAWTQVTGYQSNAWAVHDNLLWKADVNSVCASTTGTGGWSNAVVVGDPGTPVQAMVSHGGKLYAAKPEGIYEISYPDTYPSSGTPTANLMLDFNTERCPRTWLLDWHSGLYFPGLGGVFEFKNSVLRNLWEDKVDEGAIDTPAFSAGWIGGSKTEPIPRYTRPRSWAPLYDKGPVAWTAAHGTTRGILFARCNPHLETSDLVWFDGRNWFSLVTPLRCDEEGAPKAVAEYITSCFVQDAGGGRGWMWYSGGFWISRTEWPTWTDDTVDDETVEYERYGQATTSWFSLNQQSKSFLVVKLGMTSEQLSATRIVKAWYRTQRGTAWTSIGTFDTSPYEELTINAVARRIQFKLVFDTGVTSSTITPVVEQLDLFYQTIPEITKTHQVIISCAGDLALRTGGVDGRTAGEIVADLRLLIGNPTMPYTDALGGTRNVRVTALTVQLMNLHTGPGPAEVGTEAQAIVNLLEV